MSNSFDSDKHQAQRELTQSYQDRIDELEKMIINKNEKAMQGVRDSNSIRVGFTRMLFDPKNAHFWNKKN